MTTQENMLARYNVLHELGRGAMGAVYAARDRETGAVVALKRLDPAFLSKCDANFAGRFLKHARSARLLKHPNIVRIHDAGEVGGTVYVAMEMLEGQSLRNILDAGPVRIARAMQIAHDIASGLAQAHLEGAVHGAIKPSNVIVLRSGVVKITDFGVGQAAPSYMSPEQVRGDPVDHRCDIFSLGALFYEMLAHRRPFEGGSPKEISENILRAKPPLPSDLNPHVPRALDAMVVSMLAGDPAARMPGAPILLRELQRLEEGLGLELGSGAASAGTEEPAASVAPARSEPQPGPPPFDASRFRDGAPLQDAPQITDREAFDYHKAIAMMERESRPQPSSGVRPVIFAAALVLAVLGVGLAGFMYYLSGANVLGAVASRMQEALVTALEASRPTAAPPMAEATKEPATAPVAPQASPPLAVDDGQAQQGPSGTPLAQTESPVARAPEQPEAAVAAPAQEPPRAMRPTAKVAKQQPGGLGTPSAQTESVVASAPEQPEAAGAAPAQEPPRAIQPASKVPKRQPGSTAKLIFAVSPRGEIYIDGKHHGTTPPITTFDIEPGMHRIEVRSGSRKPFLTYMTAQAGDVRRIRHDFDASRAVPPSRSASWQDSNRSAR